MILLTLEGTSIWFSLERCISESNASWALELPFMLGGRFDCEGGVLREVTIDLLSTDGITIGAEEIDSRVVAWDGPGVSTTV
jgi:hypothetical protein